jgi:hypothetical protein
MTHTPAKSAAGAGIEARMQVGRDVGSAHCASEALLRVQDWAPVRAWDLSAGCRWAVRPSSCQGSKDAQGSCKILRVWVAGAWVVIALLGPSDVMEP